MSFREGMEIDTTPTSTSAGDGRRIAIVGGIGGLLIVVVALFLGIDPGTVPPHQAEKGPGQGVEGPPFDLSQCVTGEDANRFVQCRVVATTNSVDAVWKELLPGYNPPHITLFSREVPTGCGLVSFDFGPFYCPVDQTVYLDTNFLQVLVDYYGSSPGAVAQEYVVAHEYGHHVQNLQGLVGRRQQDAQGAQGAGVRTELQADCYAGVWAHYAPFTKEQSTGVPFLEPLTAEDIADALSAASAVGDDRIQRAATGTVNPESWKHGSSAQRQRWFAVGYQTGDPSKCDTFATNDLG